MAKKVSLDNLLQESDIVVLSITSDEKNRDFMDQKKFQKMKSGAVFLNHSRPFLVNEEALKWALDNKLSACWFDFDMPFKHPKLITTSHLGGTTKESKAKSELILAKKLLREYASKI
jgi:phosphoglycerate dehydrogenase-like enzyme